MSDGSICAGNWSEITDAANCRLAADFFGSDYKQIVNWNGKRFLPSCQVDLKTNFVYFNKGDGYSTYKIQHAALCSWNSGILFII